MKILFVSDTYYPHINGVYYFVCRIGPILQERGHQVAVIAPSGTNYDYQKKIDGLDVHGLASLSILLYPTIRIPVPLLLKSKIKTIIKNFEPDIIHIQDHFLISKAVLEVNKKLNIPIVGTNHFMPENISVLVHGKKLKERVENFLWKDFSKIYHF
jgi:glycosyltransferase involved in cell wall biosynthesis